MRHHFRIGAAALTAGALGVAGIGAVAATPTATGRVATTVGLTDTTTRPNAVGLSGDGKGLSTFTLSAPGEIRAVGTLTGLQTDTKLVGIDQRIQDRKVYGVGDAGGVYTINLTNAKVTKVSALSVALSGTDFGVDFNPAADRLRIISDTGQNLRHDVNPGGLTTVDKTLTYTPGVGFAPGVTAAGYTNNDLVTTTGTALIDLDTSLDQVVLQVPANDGTLTAVGSLGIDATPVAGFDIRTATRAGKAVSNQGYAALRKPGQLNSSLFTVDLLSGDLKRVGFFTGVNVADIAVIQPF